MFNLIHQGDCVAGLQQLPAGLIDLVFADPPFNIGYQYDVYDDNREYEAYLDWTRQWMGAVHRVLKPTGTLWVAIGDEYAAEIKLIAQRDLGLTCRSWVIWYYTFGVNCTQNFSRSHTHLFHFVKDPKRFTFNDQEIRVPSARQLVYADSRANPDGRLPDNTWVLRPQDVAGGFGATDDTWYFPRVAGTFKQRAGFHGCQMPEQLLGRIIRCCSDLGDVVLDPFTGSGTTLAVARKLGRRWIGFELSEAYAKKALARINAAYEGQPLEGAPEPVVSAPPTDKASSDLFLSSGIARAIIEAYLASSDGYSTDRVIADPRLNRRFVGKCRRLHLPGKARDWNRALMRLRKAGKLKALTPARRTSFPENMTDRYSFASEIAMGRMLKEENLSLDDILCDPEQALRFDAIARCFAPGFSALHYRWAALTIRKRAHDRRNYSKALNTTLQKHEFQEFVPIGRMRTDTLAGMPGVYLARRAKAQNLYLGETLDLGKRLEKTVARIDAWQEGTEALQIGLIPLAESDTKERWGLQSRLIGKYDPELNYPELGLP